MLFVLIVFCFLVPLHFTLQGKNPFAPAPNGAIAKKIGEFQIFYNIFFGELSCCNILKTKQLHQQPGF
jgi:hypothetical protein